MPHNATCSSELPSLWLLKLYDDLGPWVPSLRLHRFMQRLLCTFWLVNACRLVAYGNHTLHTLYHQLFIGDFFLSLLFTVKVAGSVVFAGLCHFRHKNYNFDAFMCFCVTMPTDFTLPALSAFQKSAIPLPPVRIYLCLACLYLYLRAVSRCVLFNAWEHTV